MKYLRRICFYFFKDVKLRYVCCGCNTQKLVNMWERVGLNGR